MRKQRRLARLLSPRMFKALGDANRIALLARLAGCGGSCTVSEAARCCPVDLSVASRHLAILRDAGIVDYEKRGKEVHCRLRASALIDALRTIADALENCCGSHRCGDPSAKIEAATSERS